MFHNMHDADEIYRRIRQDDSLGIKFQVGDKIGEGCFGMIFKAVNKISNNQVALKIEIQNDSFHVKNNLFIEMSILDRLRGVEGVTKVHSSGKWRHGLYLEMQLLETSLHEQKDTVLSIIDVQAMTCELLHILRKIHAKHIIHQDLKPQNIMKNRKGNLIIIDFGLSTILPLNYTSIISRQKKRGFVGTPRYASIAAHQGQVQTPKDDIQSLLYVMGSLIKKKAPWFQLKVPISERLDKIQKYKTMCSHQYFEEIGTSFATAYDYVSYLEPHQQVDYQYLINLFQKSRKTIMSKLAPKMQPSEKRRKSQNLKKENVDVPIIYVKGTLEAIKASNKEDEARQNANFSIIAHNNCQEVIQLLADKLLVEGFENEEDTDILGNVSEGLNLKDLSKYRGIDFKNPFQCQHNKAPFNC